MGIRKFLVGILVVGLLLWGPIDHSWPLWFGIRLAYLVAIPTLAWFTLAFVWRLWRPSLLIEDRLKRVIAGIIAGGALMVIFIAPRTEDYFRCTEWVTGSPEDGPECVGEVIQLTPGRVPDVLVDREDQMFLALIVFGAVWFALYVDGPPTPQAAVIKAENKTDTNRTTQ